MVNNQLGSVSKISLIILLIIVAIGVLGILVLPSWRKTANSICIIEQFSYLRNLEYAVKNAREKDTVYPEFKLKVMYCTDCIWFDTESSRLMIKISGQDTPVSFPVEANFRWIGCDCDDCDQEENIDDDDEAEKCANLREDTTYVFKITKDYVNFTGYVDNDGDVQYGEPRSCQPCHPCVGYEQQCGEVDSLIVPCCLGTECKINPSPLRRVDWLGKVTGVSAKSWSDKICLKSLREECNDYTNCSIFISRTGDDAQYPCHTIGNDPKNRCCSPLLSKAQTGEGSHNDPASYCTGYGGCSVYCGDVKCGYVYNSSVFTTSERFKNICCKPLGAECWFTDDVWQCCAHELFHASNPKPPTQCLEDDGDTCGFASTNCECCISPGYNCTTETANYCCFPSLCRDLFLDQCDAGEECRCVVLGA